MIAIGCIAVLVIIALIAYLIWGTGAAGSRKFNHTNVQHANAGVGPEQERRTTGLD